jgi:predicted Na+-dependent transporter
VPILDTAIAGLGWLGRQGTRAVAALVLIGIFLPSVGAIFKPYVTEAVFVLLSIAFLRMDIVAAKGYLRYPALVLASTAWTAALVPVLFGLVCYAFGLKARAPELFLGLMLQATASPMMAAPALAALMGLDATLVLVTLITSTVLVPFTAPLVLLAFVGPAFSITPLMLAARLFAILAGAAFVGFGARRLVGLAVIERQTEAINGFNVMVLFVFVAAVMESVGASFLNDPVSTLTIAVLGFAVFFALLLLTVLVFLVIGQERALAIGFMVSQRNMGLMLAATGGAVPGLTWLYFALSQFPIYLSPQLFRPLARRILDRTSQAYPTVQDHQT